MFRLIFVIAVIATPVLSNSTGAPKAACVTMTPQHGATVSETSSAPYLLQAPASVKAGEKISIILKGQSGKDIIKGFLVQARADDKPVGTFIAGVNSQTMDCDATANSLTHTKITGDVNEIKFDWIAPNTPQKVQFIATVAQRGDLYWVKGVKANVAVL